MANEITVNGSLFITDATSPTKALQSGDVPYTIVTDQQVMQKMSVPVTKTAIDVSALVSPGWALFINRDPTNTINLFVSVAASTPFATLAPGMPCGPIFLGSGAKAPYAQSLVAPCVMDYFVCDT